MKERKYQDMKFRCAIGSMEKTVFGIGNLDASILLCGEAPGETEVKLSKPFVGKAGKNLDEFLEVISLGREDLYITNVVKIRPTKISAYGNIINRPPNDKEIEKYSKYLFQEIDLIQPDIIVTLGNVAYGTICSHKTVSISRDHGKATYSDIKGNRYTIFPLYHPAAIIYKQELKEDYMQDLFKLKDYIHRI